MEKMKTKKQLMKENKKLERRVKAFSEIINNFADIGIMGLETLLGITGIFMLSFVFISIYFIFTFSFEAFGSAVLCGTFLIISLIYVTYIKKKIHKKVIMALKIQSRLKSDEFLDKLLENNTWIK